MSTSTEKMPSAADDGGAASFLPTLTGSKTGSGASAVPVGLVTTLICVDVAAGGGSYVATPVTDWWKMKPMAEPAVAFGAGCASATPLAAVAASAAMGTVDRLQLSAVGKISTASSATANAERGDPSS